MKTVATVLHFVAVEESVVDVIVKHTKCAVVDVIKLFFEEI